MQRLIQACLEDEAINRQGKRTSRDWRWASREMGGGTVLEGHGSHVDCAFKGVSSNVDQGRDSGDTCRE